MNEVFGNIKFYVSPDGEVYVKPVEESIYVYSEGCKAITQKVISIIRDLYPDAYKALAELYSKSERNKSLFEYKMAHRFIRCNFGELDSLTYDITPEGKFNFEEVRCPLRGECINEGRICKPKLETKLSSREEDVAELLTEGLSGPEIAKELSISVCTVNRHLSNIKSRLRLKSTRQIIAYFIKTQ